MRNARLALLLVAASFLLLSSSAFAQTFTATFGAPGWTPVPADYDGDHAADLAVYDRATGVWFTNRPSGGALITFGTLGTSQPIPRDYDGDGLADLAVYTASA